MNAKGFNTTYKEKIQYLINECKEREVDMIFLSETNTKSISIMKDSMNHKLKEIERNIEVIYVDSEEYIMIKKH